MATRSVIRIQDIKYAQIYKHWDGYPEHILPWLKTFNEDFAKERGTDATYKFAQLLRHSAFEADRFELDSNRHTGWGVYEYEDPYEQCGAEYLYYLMHDGSVITENLFGVNESDLVDIPPRTNHTKEDN